MYLVQGRRLGLRPLTESDIGPAYLGWLNDREVNRYSGRRFSVQTEEGAREYLAGLGPDAEVLAICLLGSERHIGNIKYGPVDRHSRCCEIEILVGEKSEWGKGYASEAIYQLAKYLIREMGMHRVEAKSANPAFVKAVVGHLKWVPEGRLRERYLAEEGYVDYHLMSILESEFAPIEDYEA